MRLHFASNPRWLALATLLSAAPIAGCGNSSDAATQNDTGSTGSTGAPPVAGHWTGTWHSGTGASGSFSAEIQVNADGVHLNGTAALSGSPCLTAANVTGTMSSSGSLLLQLDDGRNTLGFTGMAAADGKTITDGQYVVTRGDCEGDSGTITLTKSDTTD